MAIRIREQQPHTRRCSQRLHYLAITFSILLILTSIPSSTAQNDTDSTAGGEVCLALSDSKDSSGLKDFDIHSWARRGQCIRNGNEARCELNLQATLDKLSPLRDKEYGAAASVLSLLPTIGALLGAPTNEIWKLKTIVHFGGVLAMTLSFGGAILPVDIEDYEDVVDRKDMAVGRILSMTSSSMPEAGALHSTERKLSLLSWRVLRRLDQKESARLPKLYLATGLMAMLLLSGAAQGAMTAVELGGIVSYWCKMSWWMHFWYIFVTLTAVIENTVQIPFIKTHKLYVSSIPYDVSTIGGESITKHFEGEATENVAVALGQLGTLRAAKLIIHGLQELTRSRNSVMIMFSLAGDSPWKQVARLLSKTLSIAVYVTGTAIFASVTLLSLKMAVMVLTLVLTAGVFGRAIAGWVISHVFSIEPLIHVIVRTHDEAYRAISEVLSLNLEDGKTFQTEIKGHVFVNGRRVGKRSPLWLTVLGVIAEPYDLRKTQQLKSFSPEVETPFLGTDWVPTSSRNEEKAARLLVSSDSPTRDDGRIPRKPVGSSVETSSNG